MRSRVVAGVVVAVFILAGAYLAVTRLAPHGPKGPVLRPIVGSVVDDQGRSVVGIKVYAVASKFPLLEPCPVVATAVTDADGGFVFENLPSRGTDERDRYLLFASKPGELFGGATEAFDEDSTLEQWYEPPQIPNRLTKIIAHKLWNISGRIVDGKGKPIPAAVVTPCNFGMVPDEVLKMPSAVTDANGRYRLIGVPPRHPLVSYYPGGWEYLDIAKPGYERHNWYDAMPGFTKTKDGLRAEDIQVSRGASVLGRVVARDGKPIKGATIYAVEHLFQRTAAHTAADGTYRFDCLGEGVCSLIMISETSGLVARTVAVDLKPGSHIKAADIVAVRPTKVSGTLVDADTGKPLRGRVDAAIKLAGDADPGQFDSFFVKAASHSDFNGRFELLLIPGIDYVLNASPRHPNPSTLRWYWSIVNQVGPDNMCASIKAGGEDTQSVTLKVRGFPLSGRVVDEAGNPVSHALVGTPGEMITMARMDQKYPEPVGERTWTDTDGSFAVPASFHPRPGKQVKLEAVNLSTGAGCAVKVSEADLAKGRVTLKLVRSAPFRVKVVDDATGRPIAGAGITCGYMVFVADPDGEADITGLYPGSDRNIYVFKSSYSQRKLSLGNLRSTAQPLVVRLRRIR